MTKPSLPQRSTNNFTDSDDEEEATFFPDNEKNTAKVDAQPGIDDDHKNVDSDDGDSATDKGDEDVVKDVVVAVVDDDDDDDNEDQKSETEEYDDEELRDALPTEDRHENDEMVVVVTVDPAADKVIGRVAPAGNKKSDNQQMPEDVAGAFTSLIRQRRKMEMGITGILPLPPRIIGGVLDQANVTIDKSLTCTCRKSQCLKLFCECFAAGIHCSDFCSCATCKNDGAANHELFRNEAILHALETTSSAFRYYQHAPASTGKAAARIASATGCSCKKSHCLKKYCECFQATSYCTVSCKCIDCSNVEGAHEIETINAKRRGSKAGETTVGDGPSTDTRRQVQEKNEDAVEDDPNFLKETTSARIVDKVAAVTSCEVRPTQSAHTTAMQPFDGASLSAIFFGISSPPIKKGGVNSRISAPPPQDGSNVSRKITSDGLITGTGLERRWKLETECARNTFEAIRTEMGVPSSSKRPPEVFDERTTKRASRILKSVERDVKDIVQAIKAAETNMQLTFDSLPESDADSTAVGLQEQIVSAVEERLSLHQNDYGYGYVEDLYQSQDTSMADNDAAGNEEGLSQLMCNDELVANNGPSLSEYAARELTILAAQDAALMRELARVLRKSAVKLSEQRIESTAKHL